MQKHLDAIKAHEITRGNIIGLRKAINATERASRGWSTSVTSPPVPLGDLFALESAIQDERPKAIGELHIAGLALLTAPRYRKRWNEAQAYAIAHIDHFRLIRFDRIGSRDQNCVPVFEVWAPDRMGLLGCAFAFRCIPWQSGGDGPEIVPVCGNMPKPLDPLEELARAFDYGIRAAIDHYPPLPPQDWPEWAQEEFRAGFDWHSEQWEIVRYRRRST